MSDEEWAFHECSILWIRAPNGRTIVLFWMVFSGSLASDRRGVTFPRSSASGRPFTASSDDGHWRDYERKSSKP